MIEEHIQNWLEEDMASDQITLKEQMDLFAEKQEEVGKKTAAFSGCL